MWIFCTSVFSYHPCTSETNKCYFFLCNISESVLPSCLCNRNISLCLNCLSLWLQKSSCLSFTHLTSLQSAEITCYCSHRAASFEYTENLLSPFYQLWFLDFAMAEPVASLTCPVLTAVPTTTSSTFCIKYSPFSSSLSHWPTKPLPKQSLLSLWPEMC